MESPRPVPAAICGRQRPSFFSLPCFVGGLSIEVPGEELRGCSAGSPASLSWAAPEPSSRLSLDVQELHGENAIIWQGPREGAQFL